MSEVLYDLSGSKAVYVQRIGSPRCAVVSPSGVVRCIFQAEHDGDHAAWQGIALRSWAFAEKERVE